MKNLRFLSLLALLSGATVFSQAGQSCNPTATSAEINKDRPCTWVTVDGGGCKCSLPKPADGPDVSAAQPVTVTIKSGGSGVNQMPGRPAEFATVDLETLKAPDVKKPSARAAEIVEAGAKVQLLTPAEYSSVYTKIKNQSDGKVDLKAINDELMKSGLAGKDAVKVVLPVGAVSR